MERMQNAFIKQTIYSTSSICISYRMRYQYFFHFFTFNQYIVNNYFFNNLVFMLANIELHNLRSFLFNPTMYITITKDALLRTSNPKNPNRSSGSNILIILHIKSKVIPQLPLFYSATVEFSKKIPKNGFSKPK